MSLHRNALFQALSLTFVFLILTATPSASASEDVHATAMSDWKVDMRSVEYFTQTAPVHVPMATDCAEGEVVQERQMLEYRTSAFQEGCLWVRLSPPALELESGGGSASFILEVDVGSARVQPEVTADFWILVDGEVVGNVETDVITSDEVLELSLPIPQTEAGSELSFHWWLQKKGGPAEVGPTGVASADDVTIRVHGVHIQFDGMILESDDRAMAGGVRTGETETLLRSIDMDLPPFLWRDGDARVVVTVAWPNGAFAYFTDVRQETVVYGAVLDEEARIAHIDSVLVPWLTPGRLSLVYAVDAPLARSAPALLAAVVVVAATLGTGIGAGRYALPAHRPQLAYRSGWIAAAAATGVVLLGITWNGLWSVVRVWPPVPEGVAILGGLTFLTLVFVGLWLLAARRETRSLEEARAGDARIHDRLQAQQSELESLLYGTTHDMKTPVIALQWMVNDLESDLSTGQRADVKATLERMKGSLQGVDDMVGGLLEYARVGAGESAEAVSVDVMAGYLFEEARMHEGRPGATIEIDCRTGPVVIDKLRLRQILQNLLTNAVRYGRAPSPRVRVAIRSGDDGLDILVEDDGPGIPEEEHDRVFALFKRGPGSEGTPGSGIGLATVRRAAESMRGSVVIERSALGGAGFRVRLPTVRPATEA